MNFFTSPHAREFLSILASSEAMKSKSLKRFLREGWIAAPMQRGPHAMVRKSVASAAVFALRESAAYQRAIYITKGLLDGRSIQEIEAKSRKPIDWKLVAQIFEVVGAKDMHLLAISDVAVLILPRFRSLHTLSTWYFLNQKYIGRHPIDTLLPKETT